MRRNFGYLSAFVLMAAMAILFSGCGSNTAEAGKEPAEVTKSQVRSFQNAKSQKKLDIFIPLQEQYKTSSHFKALETLRKNQYTKPDCYNCHSASYRFAPPNAKPNPATLNNSITCYVCHEITINEFKLRADPFETCVSCHTSAKIIQGQQVRHPQKEMFMGYGAIEVPNMPDEKYEKGLTCIECHMPNKSHAFESLTPREAIKENKESVCILCHTDQSEEEFADKIDKIQKEIGDQIKADTKELEDIKKKMEAGKNAAVIREIQPLYDVAVTNLSIVDSDKSKGVHNYKYAKEILKVVANKIRVIKEKL